jgi:hypothetical protein
VEDLEDLVGCQVGAIVLGAGHSHNIW